MATKSTATRPRPHPPLAESVPRRAVSAPYGRTVLVPLDGSAGARVALPVAMALAQQLGARPEVMYVAPCHVDASEASRLLGIEPTLAEQVTIRTAVGAPGDEILKAASSREVEMLVLAIAGHSALGPPHIAPVAEEVAARAVRPVVFVPDGAHERKSAYTRLVVPLDGSIRTTVALKPAMRLAQRLGATLDLLYVVTDKPSRKERPALALPMYADQAYYEWPSWRESAVEQYRYRTRCAPSVDIGITLWVGDPAEQIIRFAREAEEDAIVLVRSSHLEYGHAPVLRAVLQEAPCPVIVVPAHSRASRWRPSNRAAASKPLPTELDPGLSRWAAEKQLWTACLAGGVCEGTHVDATPKGRQASATSHPSVGFQIPPVPRIKTAHEGVVQRSANS